MKKKKIWITALLCALGTAFLLAGCGSGAVSVSVISGADYEESGTAQEEIAEMEAAEEEESETEASVEGSEGVGAGTEFAEDTGGKDAADENTAVDVTVDSENAAAAAGENGGSQTPDSAQSAALEDVQSAQQEERPAVKGIYVTGPMAGTANMDDLIALVDETELNALVIDIKNDEGYVVCEMDSPTVSEIGAVKRYVRDMPGLIQKCKEKGIYLIARIVSFKDPLLAEAKPDWSLHLADGSIFRDKDGLAWVNPYEEAVWDYLVEVALEAAEMGFDEIQFDYIRFSTDKGMKEVDFGPGAAERSKEDVVADFTAYACEKLHEAGVAVSADVYGVVIDSEVDQQIVGQNYLRMSQHLDYICPMVYPSHYGPYNYDIPVPDAQPYDTVKAAMQASKKVMAGMETEEDADDGDMTVAAVSGNSGGSVAGDSDTAKTPDPAEQQPSLTDAEIAALEPMEDIRAGVRPWLQDFTASWVTGHITYGPQQIRDQIQAVYDAGYDEWILWNAANRYTRDGLLPDEKLAGDDGAATADGGAEDLANGAAAAGAE